MTEGGEGLSRPLIEVASKHSSIEDLRRRAEAGRIGGEEGRRGLGREGELRRLVVEIKKMTGLQLLQVEQLKKTGFPGLISAMDARAGINVQQFDTESPVWYNNLSPKWRSMIRTNLGILLGAFYKLKSPAKGAETIIKSEEISIYKDALVDMCNLMPGFRIALATIIDDVFDPNAKTMIVSEKGKEILRNVNSYKETLIETLAKHLEGNDLLLPENNGGGPEGLKSDDAARFAVSAAFNFIYLSGAIESGDINREIGDPQVFNPSVRTFFLPRKQAESKYVSKEEDIEGTDEGWGGPLGDWFSERIRHDKDFKDAFLKGEGITKILPSRIMYSLFDLTYLSNGDSLAKVLLGSSKQKISIKGGKLVLRDYKKSFDLSGLESTELWGGYSNVMDSAWKIYQAIIGRAEEGFGALELGNAFSKLRKTKGLKDIYTGVSGENILDACVISLLGGPRKYSTEILLKLPEETYDNMAYNLLRDDRLFAGLPKGARSRLYKILNARDTSSVIEVIKSVLPFNKRRRLETRRQNMEARILKRV